MPSSPPLRRGHRFGFLIAVAVLAAGTIITVRLQPDMDGNI